VQTHDGCKRPMTVRNGNDCLVSADDALARLMAGNARFLRGKPLFSRSPKEVLTRLTREQNPYFMLL